MNFPSEAEMVSLVRECINRVPLSRSYDLRDTYTLDGDDIKKLSREILGALKIAMFDANAQVDPKLTRIAELEAQIRVYETVIEGAGIKLAMPKKKK